MAKPKTIFEITKFDKEEAWQEGLNQLALFPDKVFYVTYQKTKNVYHISTPKPLMVGRTIIFVLAKDKTLAEKKLAEILNMISGKKLTFNQCLELAIEHNGVKNLREEAPLVYSKIYAEKWATKIIAKTKSYVNNKEWTYDMCKKVIEKYANNKEIAMRMAKNFPKAHETIIKNNWFYRSGNMPIFADNDERLEYCENEASKCNSFAELKEKNLYVFKMLIRKNFKQYEEKFCKHFEDSSTQIKESLKYKKIQTAIETVRQCWDLKDLYKKDLKCFLFLTAYQKNIKNCRHYFLYVTTFQPNENTKKECIIAGKKCFNRQMFYTKKTALYMYAFNNKMLGKITKHHEFEIFSHDLKYTFSYCLKQAKLHGNLNKLRQVDQVCFDFCEQHNWIEKIESIILKK